MDNLLRGIYEKLRNNISNLPPLRLEDIRIVSDINVRPIGVEWPYVAIKDGGATEKKLPSYQTEELLEAQIYICHRSYQSSEAPQLLDENMGTISLAKKIKELLEQDFLNQNALVGFYLGTIPIQVTEVKMNESEPFIVTGSPGGKTDRITARIRIDARYYRYSTREVAV